MSERIFINGKDILDYGAKALRDEIKVGGTTIENDYFQGRNRTHFTLMQTTFGLKSVTIALVYEGQYLREVMLSKSKLESIMQEGCEIFLPDGFYYRCMLNSIGDMEAKGIDGNLVLVETKYKLSGIQHDDLETITNGSTFEAIGTMPKMDCMLSVTVGASADHYDLGGARFGAVQAGDILVVDGINKRFLKNGAWTTATEWVNFPSVVPGTNHFTALDTVRVEYYPCYI